MKKTILFSCVVMAALVACYKDEALLSETPQDPLTKAKDYLSGDEYVKMKRHKITTERAMLIAQEAKRLFADDTERMIRTRSIGTTLAPVAITTQSKTRAAGGIDTLMYVVNYSNNGGYVFVSNDDRDGEILMYSGGGNFAMQDTAGNAGLKLHVEMMLAYQEHKLNEIREAEARGEEYMGGMTKETDDCMPNILTAGTKASGMPGMPGEPAHTCNVTGSPGLPGLPGSTQTRYDICAPAVYVSKDWVGNYDATELAKKKYKNEKCFGVPVAPPDVKFTPVGPPGLNHQNCPSAPYCNPHIADYTGYYWSYGCKMSMLYKKMENDMKAEVLPLLKTFWDQGEPLHYRKPAGCGPTALIQLMAYHIYPKSYYNQSFGRYIDTYLEQLRTYQYNTNLIKVPFYANHANLLCDEIGDRLNVLYFKNGSAVPGLTFGAEILRETLRSFGYHAYESNTWDYQNPNNFINVVNSITNELPVLIYGFPEGRHGVIKLGQGHIWLLDGYKRWQNRYYYADYYFDEQGKFNAEKRYAKVFNYEYVHGNMGWGYQRETDYWVLRGVYNFGNGDPDTDYDYCNKIYFIYNIKPQ